MTQEVSYQLDCIQYHHPAEMHHQEDCSLEFLGHMFLNDDHLDDHIIFPSSTSDGLLTSASTMTDSYSARVISDDHEDFTVDPLVFLMQQQQQEQQRLSEFDAPVSNVVEYSPSYDPTTAVTVSLGDDDIANEASISELLMFESNNFSLALSPAEPKHYDETAYESSQITFVPDYVPTNVAYNSPSTETLQTNDGYEFPSTKSMVSSFSPSIDTLTAAVTGSSSASISSDSVSSVLKEPTLQEQVDDAIRDFKERQKRKLDVAFVSTSCNGTKRSTSAKRSGQALEQEAREVMKQYWKRCKTSIEKSYHTTFSTGNTYENDVANAPVPQSISCPMSRRFSSDYSIATPPAPISAHLQSCNNENKYVGTSMVEPQKNLSAYNFFFHDERDRILNGGQCDYSSERQECLLQEVWNRSTPKRTSSTTIPFTTLSKMISQRWRDLPESQRAFYNHIAAKDSCRYQQQMHEYNMTMNMQPTSKAFP